jgi:hypothetical protein
MSDKIHKILHTMEECIVDLKIELCDNDMDTALARKQKEQLSANRAKGGIARAKALTPEQRRIIAKHAAMCRWAKDSDYVLSKEERESVERGLKEASEGKATRIKLEDL